MNEALLDRFGEIIADTSDAIDATMVGAMRFGDERGGGGTGEMRVRGRGEHELQPTLRVHEAAQLRQGLLRRECTRRLASRLRPPRRQPRLLRCRSWQLPACVHSAAAHLLLELAHQKFLCDVAQACERGAEE